MFGNIHIYSAQYKKPATQTKKKITIITIITISVVLLLVTFVVWQVINKMKITKNITILKFVEKLQSLYQKGSCQIKELQHLIKIENAANITIDEIFGDKCNECNVFIKKWNSKCINTDYLVSQFTRLARNHVRTLTTPITQSITISDFVEKLVQPLYQEGREERTELEHLIQTTTEYASTITIKDIIDNVCDDFINNWKNKNVDTYKLVSQFTRFARNHIRTLTSNQIAAKCTIQQFLEKWVKPLYQEGREERTELEHLITQNTSNITIKDIIDNVCDDFINNWKNKNVDTYKLVSQFTTDARDHIRRTNQIQHETNISEFVEKVQSLYQEGREERTELEHLITLIPEDAHITIQKIFGDNKCSSGGVDIWNCSGGVDIWNCSGGGDILNCSGFIEDWNSDKYTDTGFLVAYFTILLKQQY